MIKYSVTVQFQDHDSTSIALNYQGSGNQLLTYWEHLRVGRPNPITWDRMGWQHDDFTGCWDWAGLFFDEGSALPEIGIWAGCMSSEVMGFLHCGLGSMQCIGLPKLRSLWESCIP
jgi:hypothetical protein